MPGTHDFLTALAVVLCVAAATTLLFQWLKQPVVLGYLLAGLIIGPHLPIPLVADEATVKLLSELGVILLMFTLGLEFRMRKVIELVPTSGVTAIIECSLMVWLGFVVGRAFGWTTLESVFTGAIIAISSTTIIARTFTEQGVRGKLRETVVGVLILEDLIAILLMAGLTALAAPSGLSGAALALTLLKLAGFLLGVGVLGLLIVPRTVRWIAGVSRPETTLVAALGFCFAVALVAQWFGYSVALGAFLAGSLVAESGQEKQIERLVQPLRDVFGAIFFVSVGMLIDPALIAHHWAAVLALTAAVVGGKILSVTLGAFLAGNGVRTSLHSGMSLAQIGEFSFIIAALGLSLGATGAFLYPVAVAVSVLTTLSTPWLIRASGPVASWVDRKLPHALQSYVALYGSWIERLRAAPKQNAGTKKSVQLLVLDTVLLGALIVGVSLGHRKIVGLVGLEGPWSSAIVAAIAAVIALPFCLGILGATRRLGAQLAEAALPSRGRLDLAAMPRKTLVLSFQVMIALCVGVPLLAVTQPFLSGFPGAALLLCLLAILGVLFWRTAADLDGHLRAGTQLIAEVLATGATGELHPVEELLPGLGEPVSVTLKPDSPAVGKTLGELNLRGLTGATVLAIRRDHDVLLPGPKDVLRAGDALALAGAHEATDAAKQVLVGPAA